MEHGNKSKKLGSRIANRINKVMKNLNAKERNWKLVDCLLAEMGWQGRGRRHLIYYLIEHPEEGKG